MATERMVMTRTSRATCTESVLGSLSTPAVSPATPPSSVAAPVA